jgi:hypothetical protein
MSALRRFSRFKPQARATDISRVTQRPAFISFVLALAAAAGLLVALGSSISSVLVLVGVAAVGVLAVDRDARHHPHR